MNDIKNESQKSQNGLSDEELMSNYQSGDFLAFEILYKRHSGRILGFLKKKSSNENAQDLLQEVFIKLHRSRDKYDSQYPFLPWIFTVAQNTLLDSYKKSESRIANRVVSSPDLLANLVVEESLSDEGPDLSTFLHCLPQTQKRAIELRYLHDWSFEKIASELQTSEDNVRQLMSRGVKRLRLAFSSKG